MTSTDLLHTVADAVDRGDQLNQALGEMVYQLAGYRWQSAAIATVQRLENALDLYGEDLDRWARDSEPASVSFVCRWTADRQRRAA